MLDNACGLSETNRAKRVTMGWVILMSKCKYLNKKLNTQCKFFIRFLFLFFYQLRDYWHRIFLAPLEHIFVCSLHRHGCQVISLRGPFHSLCQASPYDSNGSLKAWQRCIPIAVWQGWAAMVSAHLVPHLPSTAVPLTRAPFQVCSCGVCPGSLRRYAAQKGPWLQCRALIPRIFGLQLSMFLFSFRPYCIVDHREEWNKADSIKR